MDLRVVITDENDEVVDQLTVYQNGSDSEGAAEIRSMIESRFTVEEED